MIDVTVVVDTTTPVAPACVTTEVLVIVWVGSEKVPKPTEKPPPAEQQSSADWPMPQQNWPLPQAASGQKSPVSTAPG
jgi:hypothetical protein